MQDALIALVVEHFDVPQDTVRIDVEETPPGKCHPLFTYPYRAYVRFQSDLPPDERKFAFLLPPLQRITKSADVNCNFISLPQGPLMPNHIKIRRLDGEGLEEKDRDDLAALLATHGHADCTVEFIGADGLLIKGLSLTELPNHQELDGAILCRHFKNIEMSAVSVAEMRGSGRDKDPPRR